MVSLIVGIPGLGKTTSLIETAARASRGELVGDLQEPVTCLFATAEDALAEVVVPRLSAAGADLDRVHVLRVRRDAILGGMIIPDDLEPLRNSMMEHEVRLLIIDPLVAHLGGTLDSHKDQHVRRALAPLKDLAERTGAAIVAVMHLNKSETSDVLTKIGGSVGFGAACRSVLLLAADPEDREGPTRILAHAKCNVGPLAPSLRFRIETRHVPGEGDEPVSTSGLVWCGEAVGVVAGDLIVRDAEEKDAAVREATTFLKDLLADGPVAAKIVEQELQKAHIPERAWKKAKLRLGIPRTKDSFVGGWVWTLPIPESGRLPKNVQIRGNPVETRENPSSRRDDTGAFEDGHGVCPSSKANGASTFGSEDPEQVAIRLFGARRVPREPGEDDV
jgi:hypothetical protein